MVRRAPWIAAMPAVATLASAPLAHAVETPRPHDITSYPVVYGVPATKDVVERRDVAYGKGAAGPLRLDLYYPAAPAARRVWPAVVFANGVGDGPFGKLKDWEIYRTWARLVAAHGLVGVTMEAEPGRTGDNLKTLVDHLAREAQALSIDGSRLAVWSCSANVSTALPYLMTAAPAGVKAAVVYYGSATVPRLRKDLPVFYVLAGKDARGLNEGIRGLWARAAQDMAPWRMLSAPGLPHAFDALDESPVSKRLVKDTVAFLVEQLAPPEPAPVVPAAQRALAHSFGQEWDKAEAAYREILDKDPADRTAQRLLGWSLQQQGRSAEAIEVFRKALALGEDGALIHQQLAAALLGAGRAPEAVDGYRKAIALGAGGPFVEQGLGLALLRAGRFDEAIAALQHALEGGVAPGPGNYNLACALAIAGRRDEAVERLRRALDAGFGRREDVASDPDLAGLRGDPRFEELLARLR